MSQERPTTTGMASTYTSNSDFQQQSAALAVPEVSARVAEVLHRNQDRGFTLVDYGTGPGTSGMALFRAVIDEVRQTDPAREITVVHQDLPGNAWGDLRTRLSTDPRSYLHQPDPPPVLAAVGSFYRRSLPPGSVHFGMSFMAAHWMSVQQHARIRSSAALVDAEPGDERWIAADAALDWEHFWRSREVELAAGGGMVVKCIGSLEDRTESSTLGVLRILGEAFQAAADQGLLSEDAADGFTLSEYPRTVREARAPFDAGILPDLRLDDAEVRHETSPYHAQYEADGDAAAYARRLTAFVRAFTESSVRGYLVTDPGGSIAGTTRESGTPSSGAAARPSVDAVVDWLFDWCEGRWRADPDVHPFEAWTLTVAAHRI